MPDGRHFIFLGDAQTTENHHIRIGSLDSPQTQILLSAVTRVAYSPPGYLVYVNQGALVAHPFDVKSLKLSGDPTTLVEHVAEVGANHEFDFSVSENGVLAYQTGSAKSQLVWFDRAGESSSPWPSLTTMRQSFLLLTGGVRRPGYLMLMDARATCGYSISRAARKHD